MYTGVATYSCVSGMDYVYMNLCVLMSWSVVWKCHILNYTLHYSHRDNGDVEDLPVKGQRL